MPPSPAHDTRPTIDAAGAVDAETLREAFPSAGQIGSFRWLFAEVFRAPDLKRVLPGLGVAALLYNLLGLAMSLAMLQIMDRVVVNHSHETLVFLVAGAVAALLLEELLRALNGAVTGWIGARFEHRVTLAALAKMMHVPLQRLRAEEPGVHVERVAAVARVADFYSGKALLVLFDLPFTPLFLLAIVAIGGRVVLVPLAIMAVFVWVGSRLARQIRANVDRHLVIEDRRIGFLIEVLTGIHSVKTMMMEAQMLRRYERLQGGNAEIGAALAHGNAMASSAGTVFAQVMTVFVIFASAISVLDAHMTPGGLAACMTLAVRSLQPLRRALVVWLSYQTIIAARTRLQEVADMPARAERDLPVMPRIEGTLTLDEVRVASEDGTPILDGASLALHRGRCVAIDGRSGSGKSTLMGVLGGLVAPDGGTVRADGRDIAGYREDSVQARIAWLTQTGGVVAGTLLDNLTMFDTRLEPAALEISRAVGLDRIVAEMKLGYETPLGTGNAETLALGTRQLISIVRALARAPDVILFDEANTSLDLVSDRRFTEYLAAQKAERILVIVTHRPSMFALADEVYHLDAGRLVPGRAPQVEVDESESVDGEMAVRPESTHRAGDVIDIHFREPSDLSRCLSPLLEALQWNGSPRELAEALPHAQSSLDVSGFCDVMDNLGLSPQFLDGAPDRLDARLMPCLLLPADKPAMVLIERLSDGRVRCFDGETGAHADIQPPSTPHAVVTFQRKESVGLPSGGSWFDRLAWRFRRHFLMAFLLTLASTVLGLTAPLFVRAVYDHVLPTGDLVAGGMLLLGVCIALGLDFYLRRLKSRLVSHVAGRTEFVMGTTIFRSVIGLPLERVENVPVNRQISRLRGFESLREFFLGPLTVMALDMPANVAILLALAVMNPRALVVIAAAAALYALLFYGTRGTVERAVARQSQCASARWEFVNETLTQMALIRSTGARGAWLERFRELSGKAVYAAYRHNQIHARITGAAQTLANMTGLATLAVSTYVTIEGTITSGTLIATTMLVWRLTGPLQSFFLAITSLSRMSGNMRQIENLMKLPPETDTGVRQTLRGGSGASGLAFARVSFRYGADSDPTLLGVQLAVRPGQMAVIVGNNGSGKSTLLKLIVRSHLPQAGTILLDGLDIRQLTAADLRSRIAYMPQDSDIFYGTVAQNLRLVHPTASDAELAWAVGMAGMADDVKALPRGLETRISGSRSERLPNGFRQKLALARVMLKPASLVLLDEPGTGLDVAGAAALERCVQWLRGRCTILMVSHRPSQMRLADTVIVMNRGSVVASGAFEQVKERISMGNQA